MILCVEMVAKQQLALPKSRKYQLSRSWKQESIPKRHRHLSGDKNLWKTDLYSSLKCNLEKNQAVEITSFENGGKKKREKLGVENSRYNQTQIQCVIPPLLLLIPTMRIEARKEPFIASEKPQLKSFQAGSGGMGILQSLGFPFNLWYDYTV